MSGQSKRTMQRRDKQRYEDFGKEQNTITHTFIGVEEFELSEDVEVTGNTDGMIEETLTTTDETAETEITCRDDWNFCEVGKLSLLKSTLNLFWFML